MRLTVLGCGPAAPQPDTPASGLLVQSGSGAILLDCGQGVAARLVKRVRLNQLSAIVIGHMHADHYIDLSALRYRFPWGDRAQARLPVYLPPGGRTHIGLLAAAISERPGFFDDAFDLQEFDPASNIVVGEAILTFVPGRHYVPAWGVSVTEPGGSRLVYAGDTGPNPDLVAAASGADLLVCEATLGSVAEDDPVHRGHLSLEETLEVARQAQPRQLLVTHYPSTRRRSMTQQVATLGSAVVIARPDLVLDVAGPRAGAAGAAGRDCAGRG